MDEVNARRVERQIRNFERALSAYNFDEPFARFLGSFFKDNKQMGASDRRITSRYCYNYFRLGSALSTEEAVVRLTVAEFLCEDSSELVALFQPTWLPHQSLDLPTKLKYISDVFDYDLLTALFPLDFQLSKGIKKEDFLISQLVQPDLFIRAKFGKEALVEKYLIKAGVEYRREGHQTYRLPNGSKLQNIPELRGFVEVQDFSSQESLNLLEVKAGESWWDACAASGGKSLLLLDKEPNINLLVSDLRLSILRNLDQRFQRSGVKNNYRKKVIDLSNKVDAILHDEYFDGVILDVPCSGSGTWGRTPEMIQQFSKESIHEFANLQKKIA